MVAQRPVSYKPSHRQHTPEFHARKPAAPVFASNFIYEIHTQATSSSSAARLPDGLRHGCRVPAEPARTRIADGAQRACRHQAPELLDVPGQQPGTWDNEGQPGCGNARVLVPL